MTVKQHMPPSSKIQWPCNRQRKGEWGEPMHSGILYIMCHPCLSWTCQSEGKRQRNNHQKWLAAWKFLQNQIVGKGLHCSDYIIENTNISHCIIWVTSWKHSWDWDRPQLETERCSMLTSYSYTHTHTHAHACTHTPHTHMNHELVIQVKSIQNT